MEIKEIKKDVFAVRLVKGEEVIECLQDIAKNKNITFASVEGIGAVENVEIGYYNPKIADYTKKVFKEDFELVSALGNIAALNDQSPFAHIHVAIGRTDFSLLGGHLFSATVLATAEFFLQSYPADVKRVMDKDVNLKLWDLERCKIKA